MNIALLHYWLTNMRGGENVLTQFCKLYPSANIFTHAYNANKISEVISKQTINTTFINKLPGAKNNCQKYLPLMPHALNKINLNAYDFILSSESGPIKGINKPPHATHVCYCHTPMRYLWDMYQDYYHATNLVGKLMMKIFKAPLRKYDLKSAENVDYFIANSKFVANRIKRIYDRDATVIHPPVNVDFYAQTSQNSEQQKDYYLFVGQLIPYKQPQLAIEACRKLGRKLIVIGTGSLLPILQKHYQQDNIIFKGRLEEEQLRNYYAGAKALLFPGIEDFGIVSLEAQATGTPVIALNKGGALETVIAQETGLFFDQVNVERLCAAIEEFESLEFNSTIIKKHAAKFSEQTFCHKIANFNNQFIN